ncbi:MAG TPA: hypothetical protein PLP17_00375 [Oligoflexia bacterium]|nr:hypothetical protein [Oligoflexia bacterium]
MAQNEVIRIAGARENNLKNLSCVIPRNTLTAVAGPSGSGKSSLVFDTIYREALLRFGAAVGSIQRNRSRLIRHSRGNVARPAVDSVEGLSYAIAVGPRGRTSVFATVASFTGAYDCLRLLFVRFGTSHCPGCAEPLTRRRPDEAVAEISDRASGSRIEVLARLGKLSKEEVIERREKLASSGFSRVRICGADIRWDNTSFLDDLSICGVFEAEDEKPETFLVVDSFTLAQRTKPRLLQAVDLALAAGAGRVLLQIVQSDGTLREENICAPGVCLKCGLFTAPVAKEDFAYYSAQAWCRACEGRGLATTAAAGGGGDSLCRECRGARLERNARAHEMGGQSFAEVFCATAEQAQSWLARLYEHPEALAIQQSAAVYGALLRLSAVFESLNLLGAGYLELNRSLSTLSTGELQRVHLARELSHCVSGVLYLIDEPTLGLHPQDVGSLLAGLRRLVDAGSSVVAVEHDLSLLAAADYVLELGPGAGADGGEIVFAGSPVDLQQAETKTGIQLRRHISAVGCGSSEMTDQPPVLSCFGLRKHNLQGFDFCLPLGKLTAIAGVSGAGKSTLVFDAVLPALSQILRRAKLPGSTEQDYDGLERIDGWDKLAAVVDARRGGSARNRRSTVATMSGIHRCLREIFAQTIAARMKGLSPRHFSLNTGRGACPACTGLGEFAQNGGGGEIVMSCGMCAGTGYRDEISEIKYRGWSIGDVLELTAADCRDEFRNFSELSSICAVLEEIGLGYLKLSQKTHTLSHGERQRLMLVGPLVAAERGGVLFAFDEPTAGLHAAEIDALLSLLRRLTKAGSTVVVIEHNVQIIGGSDYVLELGPGGGSRGGRIIACGTVQEIINHTESVIGPYLSKT